MPAMRPLSLAVPMRTPSPASRLPQVRVSAQPERPMIAKCPHWTGRYICPMIHTLPHPPKSARP
ncbi:hypothetical protein UCMB321_4807 [Pseudomonas batumici]|uniref:Uncharacterized protein n=1 Tax=Pseudomonas batumici TaxID=226910 RepID=A0A0C2I3K3_9PSED|nr:hypothetical protein UCMB321_4807 [Pseudomonas batumici]